MKSLISMISAAALAALASLAPIAQAQLTPISVRASVPFSFNYGTKHLPAGTYIFSFTHNLVTVSGASGTFMGFAKMAYDPGRVNATRVIFHRYGDYYFLDGLTTIEMGAQISVPESKKERSVAKEWAMNHQAPVLLALAALSEPQLGK
jgi:hypothetical protein